jgi:hypothetical protein
LAKATKMPMATPTMTASVVIFSVSQAPCRNTGQYGASGVKSREKFMGCRVHQGFREPDIGAARARSCCVRAARCAGCCLAAIQVKLLRAVLPCRAGEGRSARDIQ